MLSGRAVWGRAGGLGLCTAVVCRRVSVRPLPRGVPRAVSRSSAQRVQKLQWMIWSRAHTAPYSCTALASRYINYNLAFNLRSVHTSVSKYENANGNRIQSAYGKKL